MRNFEKGGVLRRLVTLVVLAWGVWFLYTRLWPLHSLARTSGELETAVNRELVAAGIHDSLVVSQVRTVQGRWGLSWVETDRRIQLSPGPVLADLDLRLSRIAHQFHCSQTTVHRANGTEVRIGLWFIIFQKLTFVKLEPVALPSSRPMAVTGGPRVAFVIDDVAYTLEPMDSFAALKVPLTFAILPRDRHCAELSNKAHHLGYPVILHLPMEPIDRKNNDPGSAALYLSMTPDQLHTQFEKDVASVPHIVGINNHMGSAFTQDEPKMTEVMPWVKEKGLFFLDSHTAPHSVVCRVAKKFGVPCHMNETFLDNSDEVAAIEHELDGVLKLAQKNHTTIAIGHYRRRHLVEALAAKLPEFQASGVQLVTLPSLYH